MILHPDKGGYQEKFRELVQAYEVLSDRNKRVKYDKNGEDALEEGLGGYPDTYTNEDFARLFGVTDFQRRCEDLEIRVKFSLEELYNGASKMISFLRDVICSKCEGKGSMSGTSIKCSVCQDYPTTKLCGVCFGTKTTFADEDRYTQCMGNEVVKKENVLEVIVEKGMKNGQKIKKFPGEGNQARGAITGGVVFIVVKMKHRNFKSKGDDLLVKHTLSLTEALCSFQFILTHLDGRKLLIKSQPGEVVKHDQYNAINDEGMPVHGNPFTKGQLYIHFKVEFPDTAFTGEKAKALEALLPPRTSVQMSDMELDECEEATLHEVDYEKVVRLKDYSEAIAYMEGYEYEEDDEDFED